MEEEKNKNQGTQQNTQTGKQKIDNTKNKVKKIKKLIDFLKKHPLLAKALLWVCLAIIIIILLISILYVVLGDKFKSSETTLKALSESIKTMNVTSQEGQNNNTNNLNYLESGALVDKDKYVLKYDNYDENEKKRRVQEMKEYLAEDNIEIYSNQCLLFLYSLKENGLDLKKYNQQELEAIYIFYKAEIATSSIDLRSVEEMYKKDKDGNLQYNYPEDSIVPQYKDEEGEIKFGYSKDTYNENDYSDDSVYGTIRIQRITYGAQTEGEFSEGSQTNYLTYVPYTNFIGLVNSKDSSALNYFSIDNEYNLIVAGWSNIQTEYTFSGMEDYTEEEKKKIEDEYLEDKTKNNYNVYKCRDIPYQEFVSKYSLSFDFLMTLLSTTANPDFSKEVAKIAEKSYMVITLHEEYSLVNTTVTTDYTDTEKIYAVFDADFSGTGSTGETESGEIDVTGKTVKQLLEEYHWDKEKGSQTGTGGSQRRVHTL